MRNWDELALHAGLGCLKNNRILFRSTATWGCGNSCKGLHPWRRALWYWVVPPQDQWFSGHVHAFILNHTLTQCSVLSPHQPRSCRALQCALHAMDGGDRMGPDGLRCWQGTKVKNFFYPSVATWSSMGLQWNCGPVWVRKGKYFNMHHCCWTSEWLLPRWPSIYDGGSQDKAQKG